MAQQNSSYAVQISSRLICKPMLSNGVPKICIGPHYYDQASASVTSNYSQHIASKSTGGIEIFKAAVNDEIVREARTKYKYDAAYIEYLTDEQFRSRMIDGGCTMLFHALKCLGYSSSNNSIEPEYNKKECFEYIFFPGNQICMLVLRKLLDQEFFQQIIGSTKWKKPSDLLGKVLYLCLLKPYLGNDDEVSCYNAIKTFNGREDVLQASDVLHALHMLVLGREDYLYGHQEFDPIVSDPTSSSASDLTTKGITLKAVKGIRGLKFKSNIFGGTLCMPIIPADEHIDLIFQVLKVYESTANFRSEEKEVTSYLGFINSLIPTTPDMNVLARRGVIQGDHIVRHNVTILVRDMNCAVTSEHIKYVKLQVNYYSLVKWRKWLLIILKWFLFLSILPILQAIYTVLGYYKKPN